MRTRFSGHDPFEATRQRNAIAWLALSAIDGIGYWTLKKLSTLGKPWPSLLELESVDELLGILRDAGGKPQLTALWGREWPSVRQHLWTTGETLLKGLFDRDVTFLLKDDPLFPPQLNEAPDPPAWIFVEGNPKILLQPSVAIVGTRHPTSDGLFLAAYLGHCLPLFGAPTVSGLAEGIDRQIHELSIRHEIPTIAVLGTGIFRHFPAGSEPLREKIVKHGGAVVSEYLPNQTYSGENFVRRNRLQAALARITIPVQWAIKSGTARTVDHARKMGRPILCPRLPDWSAGVHPELVFAGEQGAEIIVVPGEEARLIEVVRRHLASPPVRVQNSIPEQLDFLRQPDDKA
jgi:DNA protecting protein DprA